MTSTPSADTFAANRAHGTVAFDVAVVEGRTRRRALHESGSLRVRFPAPEDEGLSAVFINTAGGVAGGDRFSIRIGIGENARLTATTAAAEKVYRSHGPAAAIDVALDVAEGAHLAWLPQETILFDQARVQRCIDIALTPRASLALCEMVVFGRSAMAERVQDGLFVDRWRLSIGGRLVFADAVRLDGAIDATLAKTAVGNGATAIGTALIVPADEALLTRVREQTYAGQAGISAWNGFALLRFCAQNAIMLRADMIAALGAAGVRLPRIWKG